MAKKLKDYFDKEFITLINQKLLAEYPQFNSKQFEEELSKNLPNKEFLERQTIVAQALELHLPTNYKTSLEILYKILGPELTTETGMFTTGWWLCPIGRYIERNGTKYIPASLNFIYELTKRHTGEFAIRPLLEANPKLVFETALKWSRDENVHVRRLASEGLRINLPWAKKSLKCIEYFEIYIEILSNLKDDPSKFIQKSVGNNLNDLMKSYPDKANKTINEWESALSNKHLMWVIKHGKRHLK